MPEMLARVLDKFDLWLHNNFRSFPDWICDLRDRFLLEEESRHV
jgi:hypothetical protein